MGLTTNENRYAELVKAVIDGPYYAARGTILPYRFGTTEIRLETQNPSTDYALYLNGAYSGTVLSDGNGNIVFSRHLDRGEVEIILVNLTTGQRLPAYVTVREYALWYASWAEVFELLDANIDETYDDLFIEIATANGVDARFGEAIQTYNNTGLSLDDFRKNLHELRRAYRTYGGKFQGFDTAAGAFTQVPPFGYSRRLWGPNWVLDQSMLQNHRFLERSHVVEYTGPGVIDGVELLRVEADVVSGAPAMRLEYDPTLNTLRWGTIPTLGPFVPVVTGEVFLPGPPSPTPAYILGRAGPYALSVGLVDTLYIDDGDQELEVVLTTGMPNPTTANVVTDINTAFGYVLASSYNGKILIASPNALVKVGHGAGNAAVVVFGVQPGDLTFGNPVMNGVEIVSIEDPIALSPNSQIEYRYDPSVSPPTYELRWQSPGAAWSPWTLLSGDGAVTLMDGLGFRLNLFCVLSDMDTLVVAPATTLVSFSVGYQRQNNQILETMGCWVKVDPSLLPAIYTLVPVTVVDDASGGVPELPDNWGLPSFLPTTTTQFLESRVTNDRLDPYDPSPAFRLRVSDPADGSHILAAHVLQWPMPRPGPRGKNYPQQSPGKFYDYEGYTAKISGWFSSATAGLTRVRLGFSFDNGVTLVEGPFTPVVADVGGLWLENPTYVEFTTIIPAGLTDNGVFAVCRTVDATGALDLMVDSLRVDVERITSRCLGSVTVARSRHRQYYGELAWVWSPEPLSLTEKEYLGLPHKSPSVSVLFSGVGITNLTLDTPVGTATMEYEYNSVGNTHRLRWSSSAGLWGPGLGWVPVVSSGAYTLFSPDGSSITVLVNYDLLPVLSGTPPAASTSKTVSITDTTVVPGHMRRIAPAHSSIDVFDVTEYDVNGLPINLKGAITEPDFSACDLLNLDIHPSTPFHFSFVSPNLIYIEAETLSFLFSAPHTASLLYDSDMDQDYALLFEDDTLVPNDSWWFNSMSQIEISAAIFNPAAKYTFSYGPLFRITTTVQDLGTAFKDYLWLVDYLLWDRTEQNVLGRIVTVPLFFNSNTGRAALDNRSSMDMATARLFLEDSADTREVPTDSWRFVDPKTVEMNASQFVQGAQYFLEHQEVRLYNQSQLRVTFEHRSGANAPACLAASWSTVERCENVNVNQSVGHRFHQLRLSASRIRSLKDFRIRSLVLKGLHLYNGGVVPGLTNL